MVGNIMSNLPKEGFNLPLGTVIFTTNLDASLNQSPGLHNHNLLIVDEQQNMVEAQSGQGVILTSWAELIIRPYDWDGYFGVLYPRDREMGKKAAAAAKTYIGRPYGPLASVRGRIRRMNCVSVISHAYSEATNSEIKAAIPDDLIKYINIFTDNLSEVN